MRNEHEQKRFFEYGVDGRSGGCCGWLRDMKVKMGDMNTQPLPLVEVDLNKIKFNV